MENYVHICSSDCFCPNCGEHLVGGPSENTSYGYHMYMICPLNKDNSIGTHFKKIIGTVTFTDGSKISWITN